MNLGKIKTAVLGVALSLPALGCSTKLAEQDGRELATKVLKACSSGVDTTKADGKRIFRDCLDRPSYSSSSVCSMKYRPDIDDFNYACQRTFKQTILDEKLK